MRFAHPAELIGTFQKRTFPVVQRELRSAARNRFNYWIRVVGGAGALLIFYLNVELGSFASADPDGHTIFIYLHLLSAGMILTVVPAMTADCIARERREGTLGLLRMTPLTPSGIVIGKGLVQSLRAWSLWLSILPAFSICLLMGGITWQTFGMALLVQFTAILLGLGAGLSASSFTDSRYIALFTAELLSWGTGLTILFLTGLALAGQLPRFGSFEPLELVVRTLAEISGFDNYLFRAIPPNPGLLLNGTCVAHFFIALLFLVFVLSRAARHVQNSWQDRPPSLRQQWLLRKFCTDLLQNRFRRRMQRTLDWNPVAWLQQYSWKSRLGKWGMCLFFTIIEAISMYMPSGRDLHQAVSDMLITALAAAITYIGINSFFEEKRSGALELILVSPIRVDSIIFGRAWGIWTQALPSVVSLLIYEYALILMHGFDSMMDFHSRAFPGLCVLVFLALPFFSTYAALRVRWMIGAAALTWVGVLLGLAFGSGSELAIDVYFHTGTDSTPLVTLFWCTISFSSLVALTFFLLRHSLSRRIYSF